MNKYFRYIVWSIVTAFCLSSCSFTKKIKNGEEAFDRKQYSVAIEMLEREYNENDNFRAKGKQAFLLGKSHSILNYNQDALEWFERSVEHGYGATALRELAFAYKKNEQYQEAVNTFNKLLREYGKDRFIEREIAICKEVSGWFTEENDNFTVSLLDQNSEYRDYSPVIFEGSYLVFTSDRESSTGSQDYKWTGNKYSDLFVMQKNDGEVRKFDASLNTGYNDGTACFSSDFEEIYFTRCYSFGSEDEYCKLMVSKRSSGIWSEPEVLPFVTGNINYGQVTLIEKDSVLVFSSRSADGIGGHDLYYSVREEGGWSEPDIMPEIINTVGNEHFPSGNGDTLYFSSDYLTGLGGLDIFKTYLDENRKWVKPVNMRYPINSGEDDFGFVVDDYAVLKGNVIRQGYFSTSREGRGGDDIYKWQQWRIEVDSSDTPEFVEEPEEKRLTIYLAGKVFEKEYEDADNPNSEVIGKKPLEQAYVLTTSEDGKDEYRLYTDENGFFLTELNEEKDYNIRASKQEYLNKILAIDTKELEIEEGEESITISVEIVLDKIYKNKEINLENIYYNFNKWNIREDAQPTLNELSKLLKDNPQINIQLASHTDCRGDDIYNEDLSQKRAQSAVQYIISTGIESSRLTAKGFGESALFIDCECESCTEEEHQKNRRTTFTIVE